jgi:transposase InsO family protein
LAGIPERTYRRRLATLRAGNDPIKGPLPTPAVDAVEALAAKYASDWPAWGHRKIAAVMRADGHAVSTSTVERALRRRGLLLPRGFRADRKSWAALRRKVFNDPPTQRNRVWQTDVSEFETTGGGIWRISAVVDYATKYCLAISGEIIDIVPAPIAVISDNGSCFRGKTYQTAFTGDDPLLRHVRTRVRSPQTNGVIERFFGTLKYEHLHRSPTPAARRGDLRGHLQAHLCARPQRHHRDARRGAEEDLTAGRSSPGMPDQRQICAARVRMGVQTSCPRLC